jgi:hypothetical protein
MNFILNQQPTLIFFTIIKDAPKVILTGEAITGYAT